MIGNRMRITLITAGDMTTVINAGKMKMTSGIASLTGSMLAFSSAAIRRFWRISSA